MKKFLLFLGLLLFMAAGVYAQCDAPTNVQVTNATFNHVDLTWESSLQGETTFDDVLTYGQTGEVIGIGTGSAATFSVAVRYPVDSMTSRDGMYLTHVGFTPASLSATSFTIKVWTGGSVVGGVYDEGTLVSTTVVPVSQVVANQENIILLSTPVLINATQELWVGYEVAATGDHPCGATATPYLNGYNDLLYFGGWQTLAESSISYGWCINTYYRNSLPEITGFNILRDNVLLNTTPITAHSYTDNTVLPLTQYCYQIQSVCSSTTSSSSPVCITTPIQPNCYPMVGTGTSTTSYFPFNAFYNYSYCQQIYDASEIGAQGGTIASIAFQYMYSTDITMNNIKVYLANVSNSTFAGGTSWVPGSELTEVYSGPVACSSTADSGLVTINFDTFFEWDGQSNILVAIWNGQGSYDNSGDRFYTHSTQGTKALYWYTDNAAYNINSPGSANTSAYRNNMKFCFGPEPSCYKPSHLTVSNITATSADINWNRHSSSDNSWEVVCVLKDEPVSSGTAVTASDTSYTLTGLTDNTAYDVYVRTVCSSSDQSGWVKVSFRTECVTHVGVPYTENFNGYGSGGSDTYAPCWSRSTNYTTEYPFINASGQLYFYSYSNYYSLAVTQPLDLSAYSAGSLALGFWIGKSSATYGRLDVGYMTDPTNINTFVTLKSYYPSDYQTTGSFQQEYISLNQTFTDPVYFAFLAPAPNTTTSNYVHLDNVTVDYAPACTAPTNASIEDVTGTSATITWQAAQFGSTGYTVEYGEVGQTMTSVPVAGTSYTITGLSQGTEYNVNIFSNCAEGNSDTLSGSFTTLSFIECLVPDTTGVEITGTSATTTYLVPLNNFYNYTYTQQIYTADEIDSAHTPTVITSIGFNYGYSTSNSAKTDVKIYLAHRTSSTFASTTDWTPISQATLVYEGPLVCQQGWNTFDLDTYFPYNGNDNLVVIVDDNSGSYNSSSYVFNAHNLSSTYRTLYYNSDGTNPDPTTPPTGTRSYVRSDVKFYRCEQTAPIACPLPNVYVADADYESVSVTWIANGNETQWNLEYREAGATTWTSEGIVSTSPYTISNLTQDMNYEIRLQAVCSATESSEWAYTTAHTTCPAVDIPFTQNFDDATGNFVGCWSRLYNSSTQSPVVSTAQHYSGTKSLYFSATSTSYAYAVTPRFDDNVEMDDLQIMFYAYKASQSYFIEVGVMSDPTDPSTFVSVGSFTPSAINTWELGEVVTNAYTGNGHYIAFRAPQWITNYIYIDDIDIHEIPTCMHVNNVYASSIQTDGATLTWTAGGEETSWNYICGPAGTVDPETAIPSVTSTNSATVTGLAPNTLYDFYVQGVCSATDQSAWMRISFRTECAAMTTLPYTENFDSYVGTTSTSTNVLPSCWASINGGSSYAGLPTIYQTASSYSGSNSMYFYTYNSTSYANQYAVLPEIDTNALPINTLLVKFYARASSTSYPFVIEVGVMSDPNNASTFTPVTSVQTSSTTYSLKEAYLSSFTGAGNYIALRVAQPTSGYNYGYIDDVVIDVIPSCSPVYDFTVSSIAGSSAMLTWNPGPFGTVTNYTLEYSEAGQENWITVGNNITATAYMLTGLEPLTSYDVRVKANCDDSSESNWETRTFITRCLAGGEIAIGDGSSTTSYVPTYGCYCYSLTQQLFTSSELNGNTMITGIKFNISSTTSDTRNITIYMGNTTQTSVSTSTYIPTTSQTQVYSGPMSTSTAGWVELMFTTPFNYTGGNLVLTVDDNTGTYVCTPSFTAHTGNSIYYYSDSNNPDPSSSNPCSFNSNSYRSDVIFLGNCDSSATCIAPNVVANNVGTNSVDIIWAPGYQENAWELDYALADDSVWTPVANPVGGIAQITGLTANTAYKARMKSICGGGDESGYSYVEFRTACGMITTLPFTETFDSYGAGSNVYYPTCWSRMTTYGNNYPYISSTSYTGAGSLYFYAGSNGTYNFAVTPEFDLTGTQMSDLQVVFQYYPSSSYSRMIVGVMSNPADASTFVGVDTVSGTTSVWTEHTVYLSSYTGTGAYVAFKNEYNNSTNYGYIDNVEIDVAPSCLKPAGLTVNATTSSSVTLSWTETGTASSWEIEYGAVGFTPGQGTTVSAATNPYTVDNLTMGTTYEFYVRAICSATDQSAWRGPVSAQPGSYNMPASGTNTVTMCGGTIYDDGGVSGNYSNNCSSTLTVNPETAGLKVQLTGTYDTESSWDELYIYDGASASGTLLGTYSGSGSISVTSTTGPLTLVFESDGSVQYSGFALTVACVDDTVPPTPTCNVPTALAVSNVTNSSASINWTAGGTETSWNLQYKKASQSAWSNSIAVTSRPYSLTGLDAETAYQVRVQANCGAGSTSDWTTAQNFTTAAAPVDPCNAPTNLQVTGTTANTATITWSAGGTETAWKVQYKLHTATEWTEATASTNSYTINGLTAATAYDVQVYAICSATAVSDPTAVVNFTTAGTGISNVELANSISIMPNPADNYVELTVNGNIAVKEAAIYNAFGQLIQMVTLTDNHARIDVSGMAAGMYFVRIANDSNMATKKFIKK